MILSWIEGFRAARTKGGSGLPDEWLDDALRYAAARLESLEDAEDAVMEAWTQASRKPDEVLAAKEPRLYFIGMVRRSANRRLRHKKDEPLADAALLQPDPDLKADLTTALANLPDSQREAIVLKYVHGFTQEEIAELTERTPAAVNSLLQRGRAQLRTLLDEEEMTR